MRLHRERRQQGLRCLTIEVHESEINMLVHMKLLKSEMRNDANAIIEALFAHLEPHIGFNAVTRNYKCSIFKFAVNFMGFPRRSPC
jgi:hypothetical protein